MRGYNFRLAGALYEAGSLYDQATSIYQATLRISRDEGRSWVTIKLSDATSAAYCVVPHPSDEKVIYVGGEETKSTGSFPVIFKTTDGGSTWARLATALTTYSGYRIQMLEIDKQNPNKLYAATSGQLYVSTNAGASWALLTTQSSPTCMFIDPSNSNNVFLGCYDGIFASSTGGLSWTNVSGNIACRNIQAIEYDAQNQVLYIGTMFGGIYRRLLNPTVDVEEGMIPADAQLYQNYPNPFNPTTAIGYRLKTASSVRLQIVDALGRTVAAVYEGIRQPGSYTIRWDASGLPSGVYLYQLHAGGFRQSKRMLLMK